MPNSTSPPSTSPKRRRKKPVWAHRKLFSDAPEFLENAQAARFIGRIRKDVRPHVVN